MSLLFSNNIWQKAEVGKGEGGIEEEGELFPLMMTDGLYLDDATHPVGDGGGCQGKAKEGVERYLGFDNCCNCGRTRSLGDKFHILALGARESMLSKEIASSKTCLYFVGKKWPKKGAQKFGIWGPESPKNGQK